MIITRPDYVQDFTVKNKAAGPCDPLDDIYYSCNFHMAMDERCIREALAGLLKIGFIRPGDRVAIAVSIFTELPPMEFLEKAGVDVIYLDAVSREKDGVREMFIPQDEIEDKLSGYSVSVFYGFNPGDESLEINNKSREALKRVIVKRASVDRDIVPVEVETVTYSRKRNTSDIFSSNQTRINKAAFLLPRYSTDTKDIPARLRKAAL